MATPKELAATGVVVGMKALTGKVLPRYDIDYVLLNQPDVFNLLLQALSKMQATSSTLGFYSIAGIHGLPSTTWDSVDRVVKDVFGGYCTHGVMQFPTWHRPYLALLEYDSPHRERYLAAANDFRLPYLDYFRPRGGQVTFPGMGPSRDGTTSFPYDFRLPDIFNEPKVTIRFAPNDSPDSMDNPLYTYKFTPTGGQLPQIDQRNINTWFSMRQTVRYPSSINATTHDVQKLTYALNSGREGRAALFLDLINSKPYEKLSTVATDKVFEKGDITQEASSQTRTTGNGNLERSIHGAYHNLIGGVSDVAGKSGHMSSVPVAAFDPVFWFHHCQVDRVWALWQAMHPNVWFPKPDNPAKKAENMKDLLPFYTSRSAPGKGTFYNSDDTRPTDVFGYIYEDFIDLKPNDSAALWQRLQGKYYWATRIPSDSDFGAPPKEMQPVSVRSTQFFQHVSGGDTTMSLDADEDASAGSALADTAEKVVAAVKAAGEPVVAQAQAVLQAVSETVSAPLTSNKINPKFDREWYVDSVVQRAAANGSFALYFFLAKPGEVTTTPDDYIVSPYLAGVSYIFAAPREMCDNCGVLEAAGQLTSDTTPITPLLLDYMKLNELNTLRPEDVRPFLIKHLRWRVIYNGGGGQDPRNVADLSVSVSAKISHDDGSKTYETYPDIVAEIIRNASATAGS